MFGFIYVVFIVIVLVITGAKDCVDEYSDMKKAKADGKDWYLTKRGEQRLVSNCKKCMTIIDVETGDSILIDEDDNVIRNYTEERREQRRLEAIRLGRKAYLLDEGSKARGRKRLYKDVKTGELYKVYKVPIAEFYVNESGYIVSLTDFDIECRKKIWRC